MAITDFERYPLTFGPSPVHELKRLSEHLGGAKVWAKREDVNSGLAFGGNKTRKLEYIVPDVLASGADTLVSIGGYQSNHTRQVAAVAAHLGLKSRLVQERWVDWDDPVNDKVGNIELSRIMGADVRLDSAGFDIGIRSSWENALAEVEESGGKPYPIPARAFSQLERMPMSNPAESRRTSAPMMRESSILPTLSLTGSSQSTQRS